MDNANVLFIKLGRNGCWEEECINNGTLRFGYPHIDHEACMRTDWQTVEQALLASNHDQGVATRHLTQVQQFYTEPESTIWITFYANRLRWCHSPPTVTILDDSTKIRPTVDGWHDQDMSGKELNFDRLSGSLLATQGYRGTICKVSDDEYVKNKIHGVAPQYVQDAEYATDNLLAALTDAIEQLHWKDFELLVDLIFREAGWRRSTLAGAQLKDVDLEVYSPIQSQKAAIQVKSQSSLKTYLKYKQTFATYRDFAQFYYFVHTPNEDLSNYQEKDEVFRLVRPREIARLTLEYGLSQWVLDKVG